MRAAWVNVGRVAQPACIVLMSVQSTFAWAPAASRFAPLPSASAKLHVSKATRMLHSLRPAHKASSSVELYQAQPFARSEISPNQRSLFLRGGAPLSMSAKETSAEGGPNSEHLVGPEGVFSGYLEPESGRYVMYVAAGCPYAARPWFIVKYYGLEDAVQIVRCFPGNGEDGWFLKPVSEWEKTVMEGNADAHVDEDPVDGVTHMREFYAAKAPEYEGKVTVPVFYDKKAGKIISTDSMSLAKALCGKGMRAARTRNKDVELLPSADDAAGTKAMNELCDELTRDLTSKVYKIHGSPTQADHTQFTKELFATFGKLDKMLTDSNADSSKQFLVGGEISFADTLLFHTAVRFELAYRWRFNIGGDSLVDKYPAVWNLVKRFLAIEGISGKDGALLPKDVTRTYWTSVPLAKMGAIKTPVPMLPSDFTPTGLA